MEQTHIPSWYILQSQSHSRKIVYKLQTMFDFKLTIMLTINPLQLNKHIYLHWSGVCIVVVHLITTFTKTKWIMAFLCYQNKKITQCKGNIKSFYTIIQHPKTTLVPVLFTLRVWAKCWINHRWFVQK